MPSKAQRHRAEDRCDGASEKQRQHQAKPRRIACSRGEPGGRVSGDADKGRLAEGEHAADAGQQDEAKRRQGVDADIVQQRDAEGAQQEWRQGEQQDGARSDKAQLEGAHSSASSSSAGARLNERHSSTGMRMPNTTTSLKALLQNEAKLSRSPTSTAPSAVTG